MNSDSSLIGFKDYYGVVKIPPKFTGLTSAKKFDNIIAVIEEDFDGVKTYYLTKTGEIVGRDSLYLFDNGVDCESEGFIRFRDHKSDMAGMINRKGEIVIPAVYNDLMRVMNGMVIALRGAEKKNLNQNHLSDDNHFSWVGGSELLLDTSNAVLIDSFKYDNNLNLYSLEISDKPNPKSNRQNFLGKDGKYYSFIDFDKEFRSWLKETLLNDLTKDKLLYSSYANITFWNKGLGWISEPRGSFIDGNFKTLRKKLLELNSVDCEYDINTEGLNRFIYSDDDYNEFFNNCGESSEWIYPVKNIVVSHSDNSGFYQDHFDFLRTSNGYRLIGISLAKSELK